MKLLLISNSTNPGESYLGWCQNEIGEYCKKYGVSKVLFIPFAGVTFSYDEYEQKVQNVFRALGLDLYSIHKETDPIKAVKGAEAIAVGGGNTFHLVREMQKLGLMKAIAERVRQGIPYMGWSAGSNVACPTLRTTNDMPIVEPESFDCMGLIPFQINPHYLDAHPANHGGETREQRIEEFLVANPDVYVAGLREATLLLYADEKLILKGRNPLRVFKYGMQPVEKQPGDDIQFLL
ncbi:MAG TPA: dipeptidase PepE [Lentimicrobium sp.]|nr:dipeptidase PepE [Lentimicrobium sp.]